MEERLRHPLLQYYADVVVLLIRFSIANKYRNQRSFTSISSSLLVFNARFVGIFMRGSLSLYTLLSLIDK